MKILSEIRKKRALSLCLARAACRRFATDLRLTEAERRAMETAVMFLEELA